jgi:DNA-binding transcriptional LysR family regulator
MELRQLRHFVTVIDTGNLSRAAQRVALSQPALTRSIKNLEELLGVELLERKPRGVAPTEAGLALYHHARAVLNACNRLTRDVRELRRGVTGTVHVGVAPMFAANVVADVIVSLAESQPGLGVVVVEGYFEDLVREVVDGRLDLVVCNFPLVTVAPDLHLEPLLTVVASIVASSRHRLARRRDLSKRDLVDERWVIADQPHSRDAFEQYFASEGLPSPRDVVRTDSLALMRVLVDSGRFLATLPEHVVEAEVAAGQLRRLAVPEASLERKAGLIYREAAGVRPAVERFREELRRACRQIGTRAGS